MRPDATKMPELTFCTSGAITSIAAPGQVNFARVSVSQYLSNAGPFGGGPRRPNALIRGILSLQQLEEVIFSRVGF